MQRLERSSSKSTECLETVSVNGQDTPADPLRQRRPSLASSNLPSRNPNAAENRRERLRHPSLNLRPNEFQSEVLRRLRHLEADLKSCTGALHKKLERLLETEKVGFISENEDIDSPRNPHSYDSGSLGESASVRTPEEMSVKSGYTGYTGILVSSCSAPPMSLEAGGSNLPSRRPSLGSDHHSLMSSPNSRPAPSPLFGDVAPATVASGIFNCSWSAPASQRQAGLFAISPSASCKRSPCGSPTNRNRERSKGVVENNMANEDSDNMAVRFSANSAHGGDYCAAHSASRQLAVSLFKRRSTRGEFAQIAWNFLDNPESSRAARVYARIQPFYYLLTVAVGISQTLDPPPIDTDIARAINFAVDSSFMIEIMVRYLSGPASFGAFISNLYNIIDLLSCLPLFVRLAMVLHDDRELPDFMVCLVACLRLLKIMRRFQTFHLIVGAFKLAYEALPVLMFTLWAIILTFASAVYLVEPRSNIDTLPRAIWFTLVTMTTVGYGDITPVSVEGHCVVSLLMIISVLYMAIPLGIVGHAFTQVWEDRDRILLVKKTQAALLQWGYTANDIPLVFSIFDSLGQGELNLADFRRMINQMCIGLGEKRIVQLFQSFDKDEDGFITDREFVKSVFPMAYHEVYRDPGSEEPVKFNSSEERKCECGATLVPGGTFCGACGMRVRRISTCDIAAVPQLPGALDPPPDTPSRNGSGNTLSHQGSGSLELGMSTKEILNVTIEEHSPDRNSRASSHSHP